MRFFLRSLSLLTINIKLDSLRTHLEAMSLSLGVNVLLPRELYLERQVVVQIWECDPVFAADGLPDDDLVDVVKLVPILVSATKTRAYITTRLVSTRKQPSPLVILG